MEQSLEGTDLVVARESIRAQQSRTIWERILVLARETVAVEAPSTAIYRAANSLVKYRATLEQSLTDGRMPIDNNGTENALRIVALRHLNTLSTSTVC